MTPQQNISTAEPELSKDVSKDMLHAFVAVHPLPGQQTQMSKLPKNKGILGGARVVVEKW